MDAGTGSSSAAAPRNQRLSIRAPRAPAAGTGWMDDSPAEEPVSPTARLMEGIYIIVAIGFGAPLNLAVFRAGVQAQLARYPRFRSIQVTDGSKDGEPRWVRTTVVVDDHIILPSLDSAAVATDPDKAVEDYTASLPALPMDRSRPLWEFHFLDFPTSEATATAVIRAHHSLGDGASLLTLLMACARSAADPTSLPAMPPPPKRTGAIYAPPRPPPSAGALEFARWVWSYLALAWHTVVDLALFLATILFLRDPHTMFKRAAAVEGEPFHRKRFVHRSLSLDDVKFIKNAMNCTVNDVIIGMTSCALSQYYYRKSGEPNNTREICLRSILLVNTRPTTSLQTYVNMIESGKSNEVPLGNQFGYIILPFHIAMHDDPLAYVRKAKKTTDRKKSSLEVIFTNVICEVILKLFGVKAAAVIFHRLLSHTTTAFSNMIGPAEQVELFGHPVVFIAPSVYGPPEALAMTYQSYNSTMMVTLAIDEEQFPDCHQILDDCTRSLRLIKDAASSV